MEIIKKVDLSPPKKKGVGRPMNSFNKMSREARAQAMLTGLLPHEFLLKVARGEVIAVKRIDQETGEIITEYEVPDMDRRIDAAKAAAPYYAPKMSTVEVIANVSNDELDQIIAGAATEAGVSVGFGGEGEADEVPRTPRVRKAGRHAT